MCKIPSRILPFLSSIPPALWLFAVIINISCIENILIAAAMLVSILAMHHKYIKYDYTVAPAIWLWMSIRGSIFIPHYISAATGIVMFFVSRYQPFKRIGLVTSGIWASHVVLAVGGFAYYPYWWGVLPTCLIPLYKTMHKAMQFKSVACRCIITNIHCFALWNFSCKTSYPFMTRQDIDTLALAMFTIGTWFLAALRFEEEDFVVHNLNGHPYPHSATAAAACEKCCHGLKKVDMEFHGS